MSFSDKLRIKMAGSKEIGIDRICPKGGDHLLLEADKLFFGKPRPADHFNEERKQGRRR